VVGDGRAYLRADAFVVLLYRSTDGREREEVWNSRDGVTPYVITLRTGVSATHVEWSSMVARPDFVPPPGSRVFVDLTPEIAQRNAEAYVKRIWDNQGAEGMLARSQYATADDMITALTADIRPGEPALIDVPPEGWTP
jgi:hypothetical protein